MTPPRTALGWLAAALGCVLVLGAAWLWLRRGVAILLDLAFVGCL